MAITHKALRTQDAARKREQREQARKATATIPTAEHIAEHNDAVALHLHAMSYDIDAEIRKAAADHKTCGHEAYNQQHVGNVDDLLKYYIAHKRAYAVKYGIDWDERALRKAALASDLWLAWAHGKGPRPRVYRLNRNLGYADGNIFIGTPADASRIGLLQLQQRREARANGTYRPAGR